MKVVCNYKILVFFSILFLFSIKSIGNEDTLMLDFYGSNIEIAFDDVIDYKESVRADKKNIDLFHQNFSKIDLELLLSSLVDKKDQLGLNDWLYFKLVQNFADTYYKGSRKNNLKTLFIWYVMSKSGYKTQLYFAKSKIYLYLATDYKLYSCQYLTSNDEKYFLAYPQTNKREIYFLYEDSFNSNNKKIDFSLDKLPLFTNTVSKNLKFKHKGQEYNYNVELNKGLIDAFNDFPQLDIDHYFNVKMSEQAYNSLLPTLKKDLKGKTTVDGIEFLLSFVRMSFDYKHDLSSFGIEKPLTPEETLFYKSSDCEDRSALFYYLVEEIYGLDMIVLNYYRNNHISVAVKIDGYKSKKILKHKSKKYFICEPTNIDDNMKIGESSLFRKRYKVVEIDK
jgi:hypothetical protein